MYVRPIFLPCSSRPLSNHSTAVIDSYGVCYNIRRRLIYVNLTSFAPHVSPSVDLDRFYETLRDSLFEICALFPAQASL